ncbi:MAG TPA: sialidase family protein [Bacteroidia bacterium]|nr:sialidase family protein [Bacteroidia bacterium]
MNRILLLNFILFSNLFFSQTNPLWQVVKISDKNDPEEVSIAINPKNPAQIVVGANIDQLYLSSDTGRTWTFQKIQCDSFGVYGDPVLLWDTSNTFYYFHLSEPNSKLVKDAKWIDRIVVQSSSDFGKSFNFCVGIGKNGNKNQDKEWAYFNPKTNEIYVTWTQFDKYGSKNPNDSSIILFSKSKDRGRTWTKPVRVSHYAGDCRDSDETVEGATSSAGLNNEIYVAWASKYGIMFTVSYDGGETFELPEKRIDTIYGGWDMKVDGLFRSNGMPFLVCDNNPKSKYAGNIYICFGDEKDKDKNIWLLKSEDGGKTWKKRIKVNNDTTIREQFMPMMNIDPVTGYLYVIFYDRRNHNDMHTDVYLAVSTDGGETFKNFKLNEKSFKPFFLKFFGDYIGLSAYNNIVRPVWMELHDIKLSIHTAIINNIDEVLKNEGK